MFNYGQVYRFCMWVCVHEHRCLQRLKIIDSLNLELQMLVSFPIWVLETKLGSSGKVESAFNC